MGYTDAMDTQFWTRAGFSGVALWIIAFLVIALLSVLRLPLRSPILAIVLLLVAAFVTWTVGARLLLVSVSRGLGVGVMWIGVNVLLDAVIIGYGINHDLTFFLSWAVLGRYFLLLLVPFLLASRRHTA